MNVEELQQLPIEQLDRMAFGRSQGVQRLPLDEIRIRYQDDYRNALDYVEQCPDCYEEALDTEPVDVTLERGVYWLQDGHHRLVTAQARGDRDILANLIIKDNPVTALTERRALHSQYKKSCIGPEGLLQDLQTRYDHEPSQNQPTSRRSAPRRSRRDRRHALARRIGTPTSRNRPRGLPHPGRGVRAETELLDFVYTKTFRKDLRKIVPSSKHASIDDACERLRQDPTYGNTRTMGSVLGMTLSRHRVGDYRVWFVRTGNRLIGTGIDLKNESTYKDFLKRHERRLLKFIRDDDDPDNREGTVHKAVVADPYANAQHDIRDALEHAQDYFDVPFHEDVDPGLFDIERTTLTLDAIEAYDDVFGWLEAEPGELAGAPREQVLDWARDFRGYKDELGYSFVDTAEQAIDTGVIPAIVIIDTPQYTGIGDGRGRFNLAVALGIDRLPVILLTPRTKQMNRLARLPEPEYLVDDSHETIREIARQLRSCYGRHTEVPTRPAWVETAELWDEFVQFRAHLEDSPEVEAVELALSSGERLPPIVTYDGTIEYGHAALEAAHNLGIELVPVIEAF